MNFRNKISKRSKLAYVFILIMALDIILPTAAQALTSGPTQPEVASFEPVGSSNMVDLFSGDFTYNIPLFELPGPDGGYPFNIAYHGGIGMDQEATWVGLGWNINAGAINRQMRGIPDDFQGDLITHIADMKPATTIGIGGSASFELFGIDKDQIKIGSVNGSISPSFYFNSYRGFGYSIGIGLSAQFGFKDKMSMGLGLSMKSDMYDGKSYTPSFSMSHTNDKSKGSDCYPATNTGSASLTFNSREGITNVGLGFSQTAELQNTKEGKKTNVAKGIERATMGSGISFSGVAAYTPNMGNAYVGTNLSLNFQYGAAGNGPFSEWGLFGYYNNQHLKDRNTPIQTPAYGYSSLSEIDNIGATSFDFQLDFNRENDGLIDRDVKHLAIPVMTKDVYAIAGQGVGGFFQAQQSSFGFVRDKTIESKTNGGSLGVEIGMGTTGVGQVGIAGGVNHSETDNKLWWGEVNDFADKYAYNKVPESNDPYFEPTYYKIHGDIAMIDKEALNNHINGMDEASRFATLGKGNDRVQAFDFNLRTGEGDYYNYKKFLEERTTKNTIVQGFKNGYLKPNDKVLSEYEVKYYGTFAALGEWGNENLMNVETHRAAQSMHVGGFTTTGNNGLRYVYGLPAYNFKHEDHSFSVANRNASNLIDVLEHATTPIDGNNYNHHVGNEHKNVTKIPEYTHAHLLTSVLGTDYVDLNNDGITDDDLGYWVKFTYFRPNENFQWRSPFKDANYNPGQLSDKADDVGFFSYGERENYYLATAETKTHIAEFTLSARTDGRGWDAQGADNLGAVSYQLDKINIYTKVERYNTDGSLKTDAIPIKTIHFNYADNSEQLCKGIENANQLGANVGKLTLKEIYFTYRGNERGMHNRYKFDYGNINPPYDGYSYDCWGNYRDNSELPVAEELALAYPYVDQDYDADKVDTKNDIAAQAWNLQKITTPSGAIIEVDYEADDYAYVQNKRAMQMYSLSADQKCITANQNCKFIDVLNKFGKDPNGHYYIMVDLPQDFNPYELAGLFDGTGQIYFKVMTHLVHNDVENDGTNSAYKEMVQGYVDVDFDHTSRDNTITDADTNTPGFQYKIYLKPFKKMKDEYRFHPIELAALDYVKLNRPELVTLLENSLGVAPSMDDNSDEEKKNKLRTIIEPLISMFKFYGNYYNNAACKSGVIFDPNHSYVRLNNTNGFKEGGGLRVREIRMKEDDNNAAAQTYGQHYDYTIQDSDWGKSISSGVATFEPTLGGEQNALKKAMPYKRDAKLGSDYNLFTEYPFNQSYFPAPSVGYRKVTVSSLNTYKVVKERDISLFKDENNIDGKAVPTTGTTVNEFYTCKDFPVIVKFTELNKDNGSKHSSHHLQPYFPAGQAVQDYLGATQGYFIELNDMHGKQKSVAVYGQDIYGNNKDKAYSQVSYIYQTEDNKGLEINGELDMPHLSSTVATLDAKGNEKDMLMGIDYDFYADVRASYFFSSVAGINGNIILMGQTPFAFPIGFGIPNLELDKKQMKSIVTNKIVWRSGILKETIVKHEESKVTTENLKYDALTGNPVLTMVKNNFDDPVYSYTIPGYWKYEGMGHAYKNINLLLDGSKIGIGMHLTQVSPSLVEVSFDDLTFGKKVVKHLYPGDEFLVELPSGEMYKAYLMRVGTNSFKIDFDNNQPSSLTGEIKLLLTRSGRRNLLDATVGSVTSLINPLIDNDLNCAE